MVKQLALFRMGVTGTRWTEYRFSDHQHSLTLKIVQVVKSHPMALTLATIPASGVCSLDHLQVCSPQAPKPWGAAAS